MDGISWMRKKRWMVCLSIIPKDNSNIKSSEKNIIICSIERTN